jgi:hypothetical protein
MPDRELRKRVVLITRDNIPRIVGVLDPSLHDMKASASFTQIRGGLIVTVRATFVKATPRLALYRETK